MFSSGRRGAGLPSRESSSGDPFLAGLLAAGHGPPQVAIVLLLALEPFAPPRLVLDEAELARAGIAEHPLPHQGVRGVEDPLDRLDP